MTIHHSGICAAGVCPWCGCTFRAPTDVMYHRCAAMQEAGAEWTEIGDDIAVLTTGLTDDEKATLREYMQWRREER